MHQHTPLPATANKNAKHFLIPATKRDLGELGADIVPMRRKISGKQFPVAVSECKRQAMPIPGVRRNLMRLLVPYRLQCILKSPQELVRGEQSRNRFSTQSAATPQAGQRFFLPGRNRVPPWPV